MARRRRWGRDQIEDDLAGLGDLTIRLNGGSEAPAPDPGPPRSTARRSAVEKQLEGLAELAAELDLGLPGAGPGPPAAAEAGANAAARRPTVVEEDSPPGAPAGQPQGPGPSPPRTLTEPAPGVLILARPGTARGEAQGRPWTPVAAMEPLLPLAPPAQPPRPLTAVTELVAEPDQPDRGGRRLRLALTLAAGTALLIAAAVAGVVLLLGHQSVRTPVRPSPHPSSSAVPAVFGIDRLRTVSAAARDPFSAPTLSTFPEGSSSIVVDVTYHGASPGTPLGVSLARVPAPGQAATPVLDTSYILSPGPAGGGQNAIVLATPLGQGHYLLRASYAGQAAFSQEFDVVAPPSTPSPTPGRR